MSETKNLEILLLPAFHRIEIMRYVRRVGRYLHKEILLFSLGKRTHIPNPYLIIGLQGLESRTGPQRAGPMGGASWVGDWESGNTPGYVRADAREARFLVEYILILFNCLATLI